MGNNALYADTALRQAIDQGWIPGPTIINSGIIIGGVGGQFFPTPEMVMDHNIVYPEYLDADTPDEIVKAIRQNILFGAKVIKICVDCKPYGYTADEIRLVVREAAKSGMKVEGHVQTERGARAAIDGGIWSIAHSGALTDEFHKLMAQKGIFRAGTETPQGLDGHPVSDQAYQRTLDGMKNAYQNKVLMTFSTDADYWVQGKTRGELVLEFIRPWIDAKIPNADTLRAMTVNGYKIAETETTRGPIKAGFFADMIAMPGNPLEDLNALKNVQFVMKDGQVFKKDGVMTPAAFFHGGPVNGWRIR
jgi:imidazolonepropionase-like amidohydrolase